MRCIERKVRLTGEEVSFECELLEMKGRHAVLKYVIEKEHIVDGLTLPAGTVTLALYFADRNYNLYYWIAPETPGPGPAVRRDGEPSGNEPDSQEGTRDIAYYFNIADSVQLGRELISYRDLAVDVLILPEGGVRVLDEDELPENLDPALRRRIEGVRDHLIAEHAGIIEEARTILSPYAARPGRDSGQPSRLHPGSERTK